jgi:dihydrofolate reductase
MRSDDETRPRVSVIAAVADSGVIGCQGTLPWHLPADLKHFKALTTGRPIIMGRRTFESIGRPLPKRRSVIVTRQADYAQPGAETARSFKAALARCADEPEVFVIGGRELYQTALPHADQFYLTRVHGNIEGDVYFPSWSEDEWQLVESTEMPADADHAYSMTFFTYQRP